MDVQFLSLYYNTKIVRWPPIIARSPYGARMMTYDVSTGYGLTIFEICKSEDYYKIIEATEILGSRES